MKFLRLLAVWAALPAVVMVTQLHAAGPWSVRVAATYLETVDGSTNPAVPVNIEDKWIPELDISYAFNAHWSAELVLTNPQEHNVRTGGVALGTFKHLPPTLLAKYTFNPEGRLRAYVGAGANFTLIFDDDLAAGLKLDSYSFGPAAQVGLDWQLCEGWALNVDVKRAMLRTDVTGPGGVKVTRLELDPWLYSVGLRYQF